MIISCKDISKSYGTDVILENVSFILEEKEKCAIVGVNGAGKTTVFKILTGELQSDGGEIFVRRDARIGYHSQLSSSAESNTVYDELLSVFDALRQKEISMRDMELKMGELSGDELDSVMSKYTKLVHEFEEGKGYEYKSRVKGVMKGLGFSGEEASQLMNTLSGGQKTRVHLGKLLLSEPDVLLLDEPTNHLDIESTEWLEDFLKSYAGSVVIISHDRYLLDRTVTKVVEIENKKSHVYNGNYTSYAHKKQVDRMIWLKHYTAQQKEIKRQEAMIRMYRSFATEKMIIRAKSKEKMLEKMERIDRPEELPDSMRLHLTPRRESGNDVLSVKELSKDFDGRNIFKSVSFEIKKGEKVAVIGPNGVGKTTLFRAILGMAEAGGNIRTGVNVIIGYYDQEHQTLSNEKTLFDEISDTFPKMTYQEIRDTLAAFMFTGDDIYKIIGNLSGGERGRAALAKLMLGQANFLILDEPTNHLDITSKEILEQTLQSYEGTMLYISHDRYFINNTAEKIIELTPNGANVFLGNYDYYLEKKNESRLAEIEAAEKAGKPLTPVKHDEAKESRKRKKEAESETRKQKNLLSRTEKEIARIEEQINEMDDKLHNDESVFTNAELLEQMYSERTKLEETLNGLYEQLINLDSGE